MNEIKEGDMVEYRYAASALTRTFGMVERVEENEVFVRWLWSAYKGKKGRRSPKEKQPEQNKLSSYTKDREGIAWQLRVVA